MILKGDTERDSVNITDPGTTSHTFGSLGRERYQLRSENVCKECCV